MNMAGQKSGKSFGADIAGQDICSQVGHSGFNASLRTSLP